MARTGPAGTLGLAAAPQRKAPYSWLCRAARPERHELGRVLLSPGREYPVLQPQLVLATLLPQDPAVALVREASLAAGKALTARAISMVGNI